ncbi:MAG: hypothetical protein N3D18_09425 [Roseococcus sp.]|nr:hypothetical protein [Roseococcus sp.]
MMRAALLVVTLVLSLAMMPPPSAAQPRAPATDATGVASCDEQVRLWRQCIDVSNKTPPEKAAAHGEVSRFINDVRRATDANRRGLAEACVHGAAGYALMLRDGSCQRGTTGAFDDVRRR